MAFGRAISKLFPRLSTESEGKPRGSGLSEAEAQRLVRQLPWSTWEEADLESVIRYLYVQASEQWKDCVRLAF